jgi:hypothetical protein
MRRLCLVSWVVLSLATPACGGGDSASADAATDAVGIDGAPFPTSVASGLGPPTEMAISGDQLYVATDHGLLRIPTAGGTPTTISGDFTRGVAVDDTYVYFTHASTVAGWLTAGQISRVPLAGGLTELIASDLRAPWPIAVDATSVYTVIGYELSAVLKVDKSGGVPVPLVSAVDETFMPWAIALDDTSVYYSSYDWQIKKVAKDGLSAPEVVIDGVGTFFGIGISGTSIWSCEMQDDDTWNLVKGSTAGGSKDTVATGLDCDFGTEFAMDGDVAYFVDASNPGAVRKLVLATGELTVLAASQYVPKAIAVDADAVYWSTIGASLNSGQIQKLAK